jgi:hypothetical protein
MDYHQTVRLSTGRHDAPADGMCVMELSSLLAGERFSDQPTAVDPVIAALLRIVNDVMDGEERRRLIPYASRVIGTAGGLRARRARARICARFVGRRVVLRPEPWGARAATRALRHADVDGVLALCDELIAAGPHQPEPELDVPAQRPVARVAG